MEQNRIEMVVLDVDGTMVNSPKSHTLTPELCETVRAVAARGVRIGLASGRNFGHIQSQMRHIGFTGPFICNNGGFTVLEDRILQEVLLDRAVTDAVCRQARQLQYMVEFSGREVMYTYNPEGYRGPVFPKVGTDDYLRELAGTPEDFSRMANTGLSKITMIMDSPEKAREVEEFWTRGPLAGQVCLNRSFWFCLELTAPGVDKGSALCQAARQLGIPLSRVMAIGDGDNDVTMLRAAGISFAMENGSEDARRAAGYRAPPVWEDGARTILERHILQGKPLPPRSSAL